MEEIQQRFNSNAMASLEVALGPEAKENSARLHRVANFDILFMDFHALIV